MISVSNLSVSAGAFSVSNVSFEIPTGQFAALMGKTGAGKTTLLECICGLRPATSGTVRLNGQDVTHAHPADRQIGYVPQEGALFQTMSVFDNVGFALEIRKWKRADVKERVHELASFLGIKHLLDRRPLGLSGGEQQRVALGRALAFRPSVLCLDEPLSALDDETREDMYKLLARVREQTNVTTLHITHSEQEAAELADIVIRLDSGAIVNGEAQPKRD